MLNESNVVRWLKGAWLTFWLGPVCRDCGKRHPERLVDMALCIAHRALDREMARILAAAAPPGAEP